VFFINVPVGILSLFLSQRVVSDPPHLVDAAKRTKRIDFVGLGLITVGLGALEIVLDKGQEDDWFNSHLIVVCTVLAASTLVWFVVWEWKQEHPIVDLKLFRDRTFATVNVVMLSVALLNYAVSVSISLFAQTMLGYSAEQTGLALSPGAIALLACIPVSAAITPRVDARAVIAFGLVASAAAAFYMARRLSIEMDFSTVVKLRVYQSAGTAFLFVPISTMIYASAPREKSTNVASIMNLSRNIGGDIGIALVATLLSRRAQIHHASLTAHADPYHRSFDAAVHGLAGMLERTGTPGAQAAHKAARMIYGGLLQQALLLSYVDIIWLLGIIMLCLLPLLLLAKAVKGARRSPMGH